MSAAYTPVPGSLPERAIGHLASLARGALVSTPDLARALGVPTSSVQSSLAVAVKHKALRRVERPGTVNSRITFAYGLPMGDPAENDDDDSGQPVQRTVPAAHMPPPSGGVASVFDLAKTPAVQAADPLPLDTELEPLQTTPATRGLDWRPGKPLPAGGKEIPVWASQQVLKAEAPRPDATAREKPTKRSPVGGPMGVGQPAAAGPFRCALWSTGELVLCIGDHELVLDRDKTTTLIHYLDRMAIEQLTETA